MSLPYRFLLAPFLAVALSLSGCSDDKPQPNPQPQPQPTAPVCGNGVLEDGERCDDGNTTSGDGCESDCTVTPDVSQPVCGNGIVEQGEQCDDGNTTMGDGCQNDCTFTPDGGTNPETDGGIDPETDGGIDPETDGGIDPETDGGIDPETDGGIDPETDGGIDPETDGGTEPGTDGGTEPETDGGTTGPVCGNGIREGAEQCDDGNQTPNDGCENNCTVSTVLACSGAELPVPPTGTCSVETGDNGLLITGVILAPGKVYSGGQVLVDGAGTIQCVGCNCASASGAATATKLTCPQGVVSPGLINAHDHITYQAAPYVPTSDERFEHRHDWRVGNNGHTKISNGGNASSAQIRWGELRQVMAGTTSVAGSGGQDKLLRNLDRNNEGLGLASANYQTFPLGDSSGTERTSGCNYGSGMDKPSDIPANAAYLPHISEGIETSANNEFRCLSGQDPSGQDLITPRTAVIHGIGLNASDIALMASKGASLIWSPRTNIFLYGDTAPVALYRRLGVNIALGTDWVRSGSMNMLRELKCADYLNSIYYNHTFTDEELWAMATSGAAKATQTASKIGSLEQGKVADIAIFRLNTFASSPHRAVIAARPEDVVLTLRGGKPLYGEAGVIAGLGAADCDTLNVCGVSRAVCLKSETGETLSALQSANASTYPLFFCEATPRDEPVCAPERKSTNSRWPGSVNGSTAYTGVPSADDIDGDGIPDDVDNCPTIFNPVRPMDNGVQRDSDGDGLGDLCDACPFDATGSCKPYDPNDTDGDGVPNAADNCPNTANPDQADSDGDGKGDVCDACAAPNPGNAACPASIYAIKTPVNGQWPLVGQSVAVSGVVTGVSASNGFFMQVDPSDSASYSGPDYSGVFVFKSSSGVKPGDVVEISSAQVADYYGQIQLTNPVFTVKGTSAVPAPVVVTPAEVATGGARASRLEGVLVRVENVTVTGLDTQYKEFIVDGSLRINDYLYAYTLPVVGDSFASITGVLEWRNNDSKIEPRNAEDLVAALPEQGLAGFGPQFSYVRDGTTGPTFPDALTVTLNIPAETDLFVSITSSNPVVAVEGGGVLVPAGSSSAVVRVSADLSVNPGNTSAVLTATLDGASLSAEVEVLPAAQAPTLVSLTPGTSEVVRGAAVTFTVSLDMPAASDTVVALALSPASLGTVPASVTIPVNQQSATFSFTAGQTSAEGTLTASLDGQSVTANIKITEPVNTTNHVVISEFAPQGPNGAGDEFIELYNPTAQAINISGWKVQYKSATGSTYSGSYTLPSGSIIPARGYFLVVARDYQGSVAGDANFGTAISMAAGASGGGHVRIGTSAMSNAPTDPNAVDTVGYGTADSPEGSPAPAPPAKEGSYERKAHAGSTAVSMETGEDAAMGNGYDSDNNANDFVIRTLRGPQNSSSPTEP